MSRWEYYGSTPSEISWFLRVHEYRPRTHTSQNVSPDSSATLSRSWLVGGAVTGKSVLSGERGLTVPVQCFRFVYAFVVLRVLIDGWNRFKSDFDRFRYCPLCGVRLQVPHDVRKGYSCCRRYSRTIMRIPEDTEIPRCAKNCFSRIQSVSDIRILRTFRGALELAEARPVSFTWRLMDSEMLLSASQRRNGIRLPPDRLPVASAQGGPYCGRHRR